MKFKSVQLQKLSALVMGLLAIQQLPLVEGKVKFDDEQEKKLKAEISQESLDDLLKAFNKEIAANSEVKGIQTEISALLKEHGVTAQDVADADKEAKENGTTINAQLAEIKTLLEAKDAKIEKLVNSAEDDTPIANLKAVINAKLKHSATHAFASGKDWDAFEGRPWNARLVNPKVAASDYSDPVTIQKLNGDANLYFRENPTELTSLHRDNFGLPAFWPKRLNVDSTVVAGSILTAEITQGRKFGWLPKNNQVIEAEEGRIYPVQIDAEWDGFRLQAIEDSWLNFLNKEGSSPEKMSFVRFLVGELMKQARVEDRISSINGIFVQTPEDADKAGKMINRQNGLLYQLWKARDVMKKYRAFDMGTFGAPTLANIKDYIDDPETGMIARLPETVKNQQNLKLYMEKKFWDGYKAKFKDINGQNMDYKGLPEHPENFSNIEVVPLIDLEGTGFMFFTFGDNIEILENIPAEKSSYKFQWILRKLHLMGDYKLGVRLIHVGRVVNDTDPEEFKVQSVWSNSEPIFPKRIYSPAFDNKSGVLDVNYNNIHVDEKWDTDIASFKNIVKGEVIRIKGNTGLSNDKKVKNNADILLAGSADFSLKSGGVLTLYINDSFKAVEISRTGAPDVIAESSIDFTSAVIDANEGDVFKYTGTADISITSIIGGYDNKKITIYGNDVVDVDVTIPNSETVQVGTSAVLSDDAHYIELVKIDGKWCKVKLVNS